MKKIGQLLLGVFIICVIFSGVVTAEEPEFELEIADNSLHPDSSTRLTVTIRNAKGADKPSVKGLDKFEVLSQGSTNQTKIINFNTTHIQQYHYQIMPEEIGEFSLQGVVEYEGQEYKTNQVTVEVAEKSKEEKEDRGPLFMETKVDKEKIYFGEQVVVNYNLFSRYNVQDYGFREALDFNNFMSEKITKDELKAGYERIDGKKYVKYEVAKVILTPTTTGKLIIPDFKFQVNISSGDFFNSVQAKYLKTERRKMEVLALPEQGQPDNFSGLVGELDLNGELEKKEVKYGDSLSWKIKAAGTCNLDSLEQLIEEDSSEFEIYQTTKNSEKKIKAGQQYGEKEFEVIIVPRQSGELKLPTIKVPYFNPQTEEYEVATVEGSTINVTGGPKQDSSSEQKSDAGAEENSQAQQQVETVQIKQINAASDDTEDYYTLKIKRSYLLWGLVVLTALILVVVIVVLVKKYWQQEDNELTTIYRKIKKASSDQELYDCLNQLLKAKYGVSLKADTRQKIKNKIIDKKVSEKVLAVMDYMEYQCYGGEKKELDLKAKIIEIYQQLK